MHLERYNLFQLSTMAISPAVSTSLTTSYPFRGTTWGVSTKAIKRFLNG